MLSEEKFLNITNYLRMQLSTDVVPPVAAGALQGGVEGVVVGVHHVADWAAAHLAAHRALHHAPPPRAEQGGQVQPQVPPHPAQVSLHQGVQTGARQVQVAGNNALSAKIRKND